MKYLYIIILCGVVFTTGCSEDAARKEIDEDIARAELTVVAMQQAQQKKFDEATPTFEALYQLDSENLFLDNSCHKVRINALTQKIQSLIDSGKFEQAYATSEAYIQSGKGDVALRRLNGQLLELNEIANLIEAVENIQNSEMSEICLERIKKQIDLNGAFAEELMPLYRICMYNHRKILRREARKIDLLLWLDLEEMKRRKSPYADVILTEIQLRAPHLQLFDVYYKNNHQPILNKK